MRVGIPAALLYYPVWRTFFQCLGAEVVVSPLTNSVIQASDSSRTVSETCLPVKVYMGHLLPFPYS